jgi:hypothetical protein
MLDGRFSLFAVAFGTLALGCGSSNGDKSGVDGGPDGQTKDGTVPTDGSHPKTDSGIPGKDTGTTDTGTTSDGKAPDGGTDSGVAVGASVVQYHLNPSRDGHYIDPLMTLTHAAAMKIDTTFDGTIQGPLWGQPLYVENGVGGKGTYYVAEDANNVYALDETTGKSVWEKTPLVAPGSRGKCTGQISPLGITSAPYIDLKSRTMYLAAGTGGSAGLTDYQIHALSIDTGDEVTGWPIDVTSIEAPGKVQFAAGEQNQRGGLALINGYLYVVLGGQDGDCTPYRGWVIAVPTADPTSATAFATTGDGAGMWAVGGLASDGTDMFAVSGNIPGGNGGDMKWADFESEAVLRFTNGTAFDPTNTANFFTPQNWSDLDSNDTDLVGAGALVIDVPGATPSALVLAFGKSGIMNILDRGNLGGVGMGGAKDGLYSAQIGSGQLRGAAASFTDTTGTYVYVHTDGNGTNCPMGSGDLVALQITATNPPTSKPIWCASSGGNGSPIVTTTDAAGSNPIVWIVGTEGSNKLTGYNATTGANIFNGGSTAMDTVIHWTTLLDVKGRLIVGANDKVYAFTSTTP